MGWLRSSVRLPSGSNRPQDTPENKGLLRHHSDPDNLPEPVSSVALPTTTTQPTTSHSADRRGSLPVRATAPVSQRASPLSRVDIIRDIRKQHDFPDTVVDIAAFRYVILLVTSTMPNGKPLPSRPHTKAFHPETFPISHWQNTLFTFTRKASKLIPFRYSELPLPVYLKCLTHKLFFRRIWSIISFAEWAFLDLELRKSFPDGTSG